MPVSKIFNVDCMEYMKDISDKYFELAIVDPPYFEGPNKKNYYSGTKQKAKCKNYKELNNWDVPNENYFKELLRVSKNQIIWGINYFDFLLPGGRIVWVKGVENSPFSMADIAYQSFYNRIDLFKYLWSGFWQEQSGEKKELRIHPTQKPVALYKWILQNYAKVGDKIFDSHLGSGSSRIACYELGFDFIGCELDKDYFDAAEKRFEKEKSNIDKCFYLSEDDNLLFKNII